MAEELGVWIVGARGAVSTCVISGARAVARGLAPTTGLVTEVSDFKPLGLVDLQRLVFGGHELRSEVTLSGAAHELRDGPGLLPPKLVAALEDDYAEIDKDIRPATAIGCGSTIRKMTGCSPLEDTLTPALLVEQLASDIADFRRRHELRRVVVVNLASTEPYHERLPACYESPKALRKALRNGGEGITAGVLYACAALSSGCAYVNFTPSLGAEVPALLELAREKGLPHCGKDGKTGETLMKTVLAPMFVARNMKVMSWEGYNMLGNRDGAVLDDPVNNAAKTKGKDKALREILGDNAELHTRVRIDYCPSLDDWKTAWDFVHFQGFLGTKMIMQFIWQGCDSMLAAPLVLDLIRLTDYAWRCGETGVMKHTACFFKDPLEGETHDFWRQWDALKAYAHSHAAVSPHRHRSTEKGKRV